MKVAVERTFNLGNYENIRFMYEVEIKTPAITSNLTWEPTGEELVKVTEDLLIQRCHVAYAIYNAKLLELKKYAEREAQRIAAMLDSGGLKKP